MTRFLTATHPEYDKLWAAVDSDAHHVHGRVCERRFPAFCAPFPSEEDAAAALLEAGGTLEVRPERGRGG